MIYITFICANVHVSICLVYKSLDFLKRSMCAKVHIYPCAHSSAHNSLVSSLVSKQPFLPFN